MQKGEWIHSPFWYFLKSSQNQFPCVVVVAELAFGDIETVEYPRLDQESTNLANTTDIGSPNASNPIRLWVIAVHLADLVL